MEIDLLNQEGEVSHKAEDENSTTIDIQKQDGHVHLTETQDKSLRSIKAPKSPDNSQIKKCKRLLSAVDHWYTDPDQLEYMNDCRSRGSPPSRYFLRHLKDENLSLKYSVLGLKKLKPIFSSISSSLNITQLDLGNAYLTDECVNHLCHMLNENTYITDLNLSENQLTSKSVEHLCEVLVSSTELLRLNLRKNLFNDSAGKFFAELIATSLKLTYINISYNDLGELTCQYIGRALPQATTLTEIDLSWNRLGCGKMIYFTKGLAENRKLMYLNLSVNGIGPKRGCTELAYAIRNNQTLQTLDLSDNRINPEGAVLLSKGFYVNSTLTCLRMARNPMQTAGCYAILTGILKNPNSGLMELDLQDIIVNQDFLELQDSARIKLPNLCVRYGHTTTDKMRVLSPRFKRPEYTPKQILTIMGYSTKQSLADLLHPLDTVGNKTVKRQVFVKILNIYMMRLGIQFTEEQMKLLMQELDPNSQEEINFT
ncbi:hypothetical protein MN116_004688 [Schistosoma mekongi]|uniref:Leucine-rich repeat-containing protein n=1 Tax=Schistosoma mekongi TaxID=38744 RepID=A0AAE1ZCG7_SCHME|nr:hypothetical protein MN116_004688 [Schistosoma mekongi]